MRCYTKTKRGTVCKNKSCNTLNVCCVHAKECSVCLERTSTGNVRTLKCGHVFHVDCIAPWFEKDNRCPYCRAVVRKPKIEVSAHSEIMSDQNIQDVVHAMILQLYESGTLPEGPLYADFEEGHVFIVDVENNLIVSHVEPV